MLKLVLVNWISHASQYVPKSIRLASLRSRSGEWARLHTRYNIHVATKQKHQHFYYEALSACESFCGPELGSFWNPTARTGF